MQVGISVKEMVAGFELIGQTISKAAQQMAPALNQMAVALQEANKMALKIKSSPGKATTSKTISDKKTVVSEDVQQEEVDVPAVQSLTAEQQCEVGVEMSYTHNLGNYQSARVQVSLKVPCSHDEIDEVYGYSREWVDTKLNGLVSELQED